MGSFGLSQRQLKHPDSLRIRSLSAHRFMMNGHEQNAESSDASSLLTASDLKVVPERRSQHSFNALSHYRRDALMQYRTPGDTGLLISTICFGCMTFDGGSVMRSIGEAHACSPARIALAWLLHQPAVTSVIIGAKRTDQLQDNLASVDVKLSPEELQQLDRVSQLPPEYPGWMLPVQGASRLGPNTPRSSN